MTTIGIVGLGMIGGSVALAARRAGHPVQAWDTDPTTRRRAADGGLAVSADLTTADVIVLAAPMPALTDGLPALLASVRFSDTATITDVGSVKQPVAAAIHAAGLSERYVGGHPMAGTELTGFPAATADLLVGARWVLCLDDHDSERRIAAWLRVAGLITELGAGVLALTAAEHDTAVALISGVPHLLALALSTYAEMSGPVVATLAAGSFADLTRVAGSSRVLLDAVTQQNAAAVRAALRLVLEQLDRPWDDLIELGQAARQSVRAKAAAGGLRGHVPGRTHVLVSGAAQLLELGRAGVVIESVDFGTGVIGYRPGDAVAAYE